MAFSHSIYETKAHFSKLLKKVKSGQELVVTERGQPIAKIVPISLQEETFEERFKRFVSQGVIGLAKSRAGLKPALRRPGGLKRFLEDR